MNQSSAGKKKALVIGISKYDILPSLDFCNNDGIVMSEVLSSLGCEIHDNKLIGYVQSQTMRDAIFDFFTDTRIKPNDTLIFYYSGHGVPDSTGSIYLSSSEINPDNPIKRGFSFDDLTKLLQQCISTKIVVILDSCYSGSAKISKGHEDDVVKIASAAIQRQSNEINTGEGRCILAASQALQEAYKHEEDNHSLFSYFLIEGLKGDTRAINTEGYLTVDSLSNYVFERIMELPLDKRPRQRPLRKIEASGDIILGFFPNNTKLNINPNISLESFSINDDGNELIEKGDYQNALNYYEAKTQNSNLASMWDNKGIALHELGKYEEALQCFNVCIQLDRTNAYGWEHKGVILHNRGQVEEALECINKSIIYTKSQDTNITKSNRWFYKGLCLEGKGLKKETLECYNKSIKLNPEAEFALTRKGDILFNQGNFAEAEKCYDKALSIAPDLPIAWLGKAKIMGSRQKYSEVISCSEKATRCSRKGIELQNPEVCYTNMAVAYFHLKDYEQAIICYDKALEINPKLDSIWKSKGILFEHLHKYNQALECYNKALQLNPNDIETSQLKQNVVKKN